MLLSFFGERFQIRTQHGASSLGIDISRPLGHFFLRRVQGGYVLMKTIRANHQNPGCGFSYLSLGC